MNEELITKITKILCHENLELYGISPRIYCVPYQVHNKLHIVSCDTNVEVEGWVLENKQ